MPGEVLIRAPWRLSIMVGPRERLTCDHKLMELSHLALKLLEEVAVGDQSPRYPWLEACNEHDILVTCIHYISSCVDMLSGKVCGGSTQYLPAPCLPCRNLWGMACRSFPEAYPASMGAFLRLCMGHWREQCLTVTWRRQHQGLRRNLQRSQTEAASAAPQRMISDGLCRYETALQPSCGRHL